MIEGLKTYGSDKLVKELPNLKNPIFICAIATTETSRIPGLTGAGATPELTKYTPAGDAELILDGEVKCMTDIPQTIIGEVVKAFLKKDLNWLKSYLKNMTIS